MIYGEVELRKWRNRGGGRERERERENKSFGFIQYSSKNKIKS